MDPPHRTLHPLEGLMSWIDMTIYILLFFAGLFLGLALALVMD